MTLGKQCFEETLGAVAKMDGEQLGTILAAVVERTRSTVIPGSVIDLIHQAGQVAYELVIHKGKQQFTVNFQPITGGVSYGDEDLVKAIEGAGRLIEAGKQLRIGAPSPVKFTLPESDVNANFEPMVRKIMERIHPLRDPRDNNVVALGISQVLKDGWSLDDAIEYIALTEEVSPHLSEEVALAAMTVLINKNGLSDLVINVEMMKVSGKDWVHHAEVKCLDAALSLDMSGHSSSDGYMFRITANGVPKYMWDFHEKMWETYEHAKTEIDKALASDDVPVLLESATSYLSKTGEFVVQYKKKGTPDWSDGETYSSILHAMNFTPGHIDHDYRIFCDKKTKLRWSHQEQRWMGDKCDLQPTKVEL